MTHTDGKEYLELHALAERFGLSKGTAKRIIDRQEVTGIEAWSVYSKSAATYYDLKQFRFAVAVTKRPASR